MPAEDLSFLFLFFMEILMQKAPNGSNGGCAGQGTEQVHTVTFNKKFCWTPVSCSDEPKKYPHTGLHNAVLSGAYGGGINPNNHQVIETTCQHPDVGNANAFRNIIRNNR
jgi:hypothetical protein